MNASTGDPDDPKRLLLMRHAKAAKCRTLPRFGIAE